MSSLHPLPFQEAIQAKLQSSNTVDMASIVPAKSILKQQVPNSQTTLSDEQKARVERDRRNLGIALHHANKIQSQKDVEAQILSSTEMLLEYPKDSPFTPSEASNFMSLIRPFRPSDFDSLVEERRIDGKCGYALCTNAPRSTTLGAGVVWKLQSEAAGDYCSAACARKALYLKTQLSEVPAWEREPVRQPKIVLHEDDRPVAESSRSAAAAERTREWVAKSRDELAFERGEKAASLKPKQVMTDSVVEKSISTPRVQPNWDGVALSSYTAIEGHEPKQPTKQALKSVHNGGDGRDDDDDDDDDDEGDLFGEGEEESWRALFDNIDKRGIGAQGTDAEGRHREYWNGKEDSD